ncbi:hypothetical protein FNO01nite_33030 [Flavobacterium noncentrifugens]|uniref:DUF2971 domain-containing protein n=1 Tax=Flavobacterium noncentrifugens TaxID=1128970 RepID=A0A1G8ZIP4_9FLAO|nr:DUF2971 domain-containing protein [Flavobacterium noncentrifugens]GEP52631.1 hypothetical protein FNO01nite_33030 [Flavobacterium noncentrifugens]SDK14992.1 hypothetical protein SAMN04487935_2620 [Flavobacterium noncentrifugens]
MENYSENYQRIQEFIESFSRLVHERKDLKLVVDTYTHFEGKFKMLDAILLRENESLAIFEFKPRGKQINLQDMFEAFVPLEVSFKFLILSNGTIHKVLNRFSNQIRDFENAAELLLFLLEIPSEEEIKRVKNAIAEGIENVVSNFFASFDRNHKLNSKKEILLQLLTRENVVKNLQYDKNGQFYHISNDIRKLENLENRLFKILIDEVNQNESIYRYTNLDTIFSTIDKESLRLNGIAGMNDISEVGYVETYLDQNFIPFKTPKDVDRLNRRFILCSSTLNDDLIQWRLYGDDCKGGCLVFRLKEQKDIPGLQIRKINYGVEVNGENYHPELELIAHIIDFVKVIIRDSFQFRTLSIWKHFFKSFEYAPEKEVRLLLIQNDQNNIKGEAFNGFNPHSLDKKWCLTTSHKILNPFMVISLNDKALPLELTDIILGPKCPEIVINQTQFTQLLSEKKMGNVKVKISRIKNYR